MNAAATDWQTIRAPLELMAGVLNDEACTDALAAVARLQHQHEQAQAVVEAVRYWISGDNASGAGLSQGEMLRRWELVAAALARLDEQEPA